VDFAEKLIDRFVLKDISENSGDFMNRMFRVRLTYQLKNSNL